MANTQLDLRRHMNVFDAHTFKTPVTIIGAGATGSWLALQLAKLGITDITVWDFDKVEEHNVPNQLFGVNHVGMFKVEALQQIIQEQTLTEIKIKNEAFTEGRLRGIVFLMIDTMDGRKAIYESSIKAKSSVALMVEPRMGLNEARIYNVIPTDVRHQRKWEENWYPDSEAEVSACGTSQSVISTALLTASFCARQLINFNNNIPLSNEILVDTLYNNVFAYTWDK